MMQPLLGKPFCILLILIALLVDVPANAASDIAPANPDWPKLATVKEAWSIRLPKEEKVTYKGLVSFDSDGGGRGTMLYPAPSAAGFLAAVITHGLLLEASKSGNKDKLQESADKVLAPYQSSLNDYAYRQLTQRALGKSPLLTGKKLMEYSEKNDAEWVLEGSATFFMSQDQSALLVENALTIYAPGNPSRIEYRNIVRVVSTPQVGSEDIAAFWAADNAEKLKEVSAELFAQSLDIFLTEMVEGSGWEGKANKTVRYLEGKTEKMERGQLISRRCDRVLLRTLRGWLMSVPISHEGALPPGGDECRPL